MEIFVKLSADELAATATVKEMIRAALLDYSIWLDTEGLMKKPKRNDGRTHADFADAFLGEAG